MSVPKTATLLPCPFCGSDAVTGFVTGLSFHQYAGCNKCNMRCEARANDDLGSCDQDAMRKAITGWNTRTAATRDDAVREALKPFAEGADYYDDVNLSPAEYLWRDDHTANPVFKVGQLRAARAALQGAKP